MPNVMASSTERRNPWVRLSVAVWVVLLVAVCARSVKGPSRTSLGILWQSAGLAWIEGRTLYAPVDDTNLNGFRYGPPIGGLLAPLGWMPLWAVDVVWRLLNAGVLIGGLLWWLRVAAPYPLSARHQAALHFLVAILSLASLNNGQVNTMLAGLFLIGLAAVASRHWNVAALSMALLAWIKVYPLMPCVLLMIVYPRRLAPRLIAALGLVAALPFAMQSPGYVIEQYETWVRFLMTNEASRRFWPLAEAYRDLLQLLRVWSVPINLQVYTLIQLGGAAACAGLCLLGKIRGIGSEALLLRVLVLGTGWMLLLGPATESSTYVLCAVPAAWWMIHVHLSGPVASRYLMAFSVGLLLLCIISVAVPAGRTMYHASALQPLAMVLWMASYLMAPATRSALASGLRDPERVEPMDQPIRRAA